MLYSFYKDELPLYGTTRRKDENKNKIFDGIVISGVICSFLVWDIFMKLRRNIIFK